MKKELLIIMHESPISPYGGMGHVVAETAKRIQATGKYNVTVFGFDVDHREDGIFKQDGYTVCLAKSTNNLHNHHIALAPIITEDVMTDNIFLLDPIRNTKFDIIHLCDSFLYKTAKHLAIRDKCPIISTAHLSFTLSRGLENCFQDYLDVYAFNQEAHVYIESEHITAVSEKYANQLLEIFPQCNGKLSVIKNGIDFEYYQNRSKNFVKDYCKTNKPIIGFVGRCCDTKGIDWLCTAIRMFPEYHFLVISSCTNKNNTKAAHDLRHIEMAYSNITWEKDIRVYDELKVNLMAGCDLAVMPSSHEPWGIVANEWQALGIPLIATDEVASVIPDTYLSCNTEEEFLAQIKNFQNSEQITIEATKYVKSLDWDNITNQYIEVYDQCLIKFIN